MNRPIPEYPEDQRAKAAAWAPIAEEHADRLQAFFDDANNVAIIERHLKAGRRTPGIRLRHGDHETGLTTWFRRRQDLLDIRFDLDDGVEANVNTMGGGNWYRADFSPRWHRGPDGWTDLETGLPGNPIGSKPRHGRNSGVLTVICAGCGTRIQRALELLAPEMLQALESTTRRDGSKFVRM